MIDSTVEIIAKVIGVGVLCVLSAALGGWFSRWIGRE